MPIFYYKAIDRDHKIRIGSLDAATRKAAVMDLKNQQLRPLAIQDTPLDMPVGRSSWEWLKKTMGCLVAVRCLSLKNYCNYTKVGCLLVML